MFKISDWWGRAQSIVGGTIPWLNFPEYYKKVTELAIVSNPISSTPPWLLLWFLPPGSYPISDPVLTSFDNEQVHGSKIKMNHFFFRLLWSWHFNTAMITLTKTPIMGFFS